MPQCFADVGKRGGVSTRPAKRRRRAMLNVQPGSDQVVRGARGGPLFPSVSISYIEVPERVVRSKGNPRTSME